MKEENKSFSWRFLQRHGQTGKWMQMDDLLKKEERWSKDVNGHVVEKTIREKEKGQSPFS